MKRLNVTVLIGCVIILFNSCEQIQIEDPIVEKPIFQLNMEMDSTSVNFGDRTNYMFPDFNIDNLGIRVFESKFVSDIEDMDRNNITFQLRDDRFIEFDDNDSLSIFRTGAYTYLSPAGFNHPVKIMMNKLMNVMYHDKVTWIKSGQEESGRYFHVFDVNEGQDVEFEMHIEDNSKNCFTTYSKKWTPNLGDIHVTGFAINGRKISPIIQQPITGNLLYKWDSGQNTKEIEVTQNGRYCLTITNAPQGISVICMNLEIENNALKIPCFSGVESRLVEVNGDPRFHTAEVIWIDKDGREYSSRFTPQSENTYFYVIGATPFNVLNHKGQKVKKVEVEFSCDLSTEDGDKIRIQKGEGTIGFSYY
jgi:hypothetical protein